MHLGEVRGLMADPERGRDRVRRGGVDVDRHPRRQRVIGAAVAPAEHSGHSRRSAATFAWLLRNSQMIHSCYHVSPPL